LRRWPHHENARAADQFIVRRGESHTIIAGYHWFGDWGRDTMIALPGLTLATGRTAIARSLLISALCVISRTSVMPYKHIRKPLPQIAHELNVDAVVEGTVIRAGAQVRITAQLIDAVADKHLWAQSYDGDLRDTLEWLAPLPSRSGSM
jgi:Amylo-alpha-1,6-glucosidase